MSMHEEQLRKQEDMLRTVAANPSYVCFQSTNASTGTKPASDFPEPLPLSACLPIRLASMQQGTTHKRRVLRGTIAVQRPTVMTAATVLLQDEAGDLVKVRLTTIARSGPSFPSWS
jgi:hypothetical protein